MPILNFNDYFPTQSGNSGKLLSTNGAALSWSSITSSALTDFPSQASNSGKILTTNGSALSWSSVVLTDIALKNAVNALTVQSYFVEATLTDAATVNWAVSGAQVAKITLGGNRTMAAPTGLQNGAFYSLMVIQDGSGSRTLSWNSVFKWNSGTAPTLTTTANARDIFTFRSDGTNLYEVGRALALA